MSLKNIRLKTPEYEDIVPSTGESVKYRPFTVAEEKLLLIASESSDNKQIADSMRKIITNCTGLDTNTIAYYDIEYLFTKIRSKSVGEIATVKFNCEKCEAENDIGIELDKVKISKTEGHTNSIKLDDNLVFVMKDPQLEVLSMYDENKNSVDNIVEIICNSIKNVQLDDEIIEVSSADITDAKNLVEQLTSDQFKMLSAFFDTMPKTSIDIEYECIKCSEINKKNLEGMHNFF
tara:strand:+ start:770 stop:1471 length:702 start_codon:yes stop_codon:yes gene_type:complete